MAEVINGKKTIVKLLKQMSFLRDILLPATILFPVMHTHLAHLKGKSLSQSIVSYHTYHRLNYNKNAFTEYASEKKRQHKRNFIYTYIVIIISTFSQLK